MSEIQSLLVQVRPASVGDPGQVTYGYYKIEDGHLQMTHKNGRALENPLYRIRLHDGANVEAIASNLTRSIRSEMQGEIVPGFSRALNYPKATVV